VRARPDEHDDQNPDGPDQPADAASVLRAHSVSRFEQPHASILGKTGYLRSREWFPRNDSAWGLESRTSWRTFKQVLEDPPDDPWLPVQTAPTLERSGIESLGEGIRFTGNAIDH
jgi:hypothetical protein